MKKEIKQILEKWGCKHKWRIHHNSKIFLRGEINQFPIQVKQTLICEICGKIKQINLC